MNLTYIYELPPHVDLFKGDGLQAALEELNKEKLWDITWANLAGLETIPNPLSPPPYSDFYLAWGGALSIATKTLAELKVPKSKKGLCWGGGGVQQYKEAPLDKFGVVFVEVEKDVQHGKNFKFAFGTNTQVYKPIKQNKIFGAIYPAAVVGYKRQNLFLEATKGLNSLVVGDLGSGPEDIELVKACRELGWTHVPQVSPNVVNALINASYVTLITAGEVGGSGRTMLESLAANVPVIIMKDAPTLVYYAQFFDEGVYICDPDAEKIRSLIGVAKLMGPINTRETILKRFSEITYAQALKRGVEGVL